MATNPAAPRPGERQPAHGERHLAHGETVPAHGQGAAAQRWADWLLGLGVLGLMIVLIVPVAPVVLDLLLAVNLAGSLLLILLTLNARNTAELSPTVLAQFDSLSADLQIAEKVYGSALEGRQRAQANADRRTSYVTLFVEPSLPDASLCRTAIFAVSAHGRSLGIAAPS